MIKNYFKIAFRNLVKNRIFSVINILGLAIGIAATVLISFYVKHERSYEDFHVNAANIFRLSLNLYNGNEFIINDVETYQTLGPEFKTKMPEVKDYVRVLHWGSYAINANDQTFYEDRIFVADQSIFTVFSYPMIEGEPYEAFAEPYKATISERLAIKYFGKTDVVGKTFKFGLRDEPFEIVGVTATTPQNTHLKFDILLSHPTLPKYWDWYEEYAWSSNNEYTYLLMEEGTAVADFNKKLAEYSANHEKLTNEVIISESIKDIHLYSHKSFEPEVNGSAQTVNFMVLIAIFIMIIAWVNYSNLSTARAVNRAKEVGLRKVVGSSRIQLIKQFLMESFFINVIAALLAFTLVQISIPEFSDLIGQNLPQNLLANAFIWQLMLVIVAIGTLLAGVYPAFVLSSFAPVKVLKGKFATSSSGLLLRKGLVVFQFITTVVLIALSIGVYNQIDFLQNKDLGVKIDNTLVIRRPNIETSDSLYIQSTRGFINKLKDKTIIANVGQGDAMPGAELHDMSTTTSIRRSGADQNSGSYNYYIYRVDEHFFEALGIQIIAGRTYEPDEPGKRILINQRAVETLGFTDAADAVGKTIDWGDSDNRHEIIGVFDNFHQRSPKESHLPMVLVYTSVGDFMAIKFNTADSKMALAEVEELWNESYQDAAFDYYFLDDRYNQQYKNDQTFSAVMLIFTLLSLFIALLGLFGLSAFTILQRSKEISVRKVLGASIMSLIGLLSKDFLKLVALSSILSIPIAYYLMSLWLDNYTERIEISWWLFAIPSAIIITVAFLSVIGQTLKSTLANPTESLRNE